jgi:hypothetical protein
MSLIPEPSFCSRFLFDVLSGGPILLACLSTVNGESANSPDSKGKESSKESWLLLETRGGEGDHDAIQPLPVIGKARGVVGLDGEGPVCVVALRGGPRRRLEPRNRRSKFVLGKDEELLEKRLKLLSIARVPVDGGGASLASPSFHEQVHHVKGEGLSDPLSDLVLNSFLEPSRIAGVATEGGGE